MLEYLQSHIHEEIEGAMDYMIKALEFKNTRRDWAAKFLRMSDMEIEHANCLTKMFNSMDKPDDLSDADYSKMLKQIMDDYTASMVKIGEMKKLYWS